MKMVSAAKYAKADRDLRLAKPYGIGAQGTSYSTSVTVVEQTKYCDCTISGPRDASKP